MNDKLYSAASDGEKPVDHLRSYGDSNKWLVNFWEIACSEASLKKVITRLSNGMTAINRIKSRNNNFFRQIHPNILGLAQRNRVRTRQGIHRKLKCPIQWSTRLWGKQLLVRWRWRKEPKLGQLKPAGGLSCQKPVLESPGPQDLPLCTFWYQYVDKLFWVPKVDQEPTIFKWNGR